MRETDFIAKNQEKWERYEKALESDNKDPELLRELYIHTTDDLSYSRTFYPNRSVRVYLNNLAQRTFLQIYRGRRGEASRFFSFWTEELPRTVYRSRRSLLASLVIFLLAMLIGIVSYRIDSSFAEVIMGDYYMDMTRANIEDGDPMGVYKQTAPYSMSLRITVNNIYVALLTFLSGAFFGVGAVVQLLRNGVMVGVFQYFFYAEGLFKESFLTIWMHGALEISAIVIAGGAGLTMGSGLLFPGTLSRYDAFKGTARDGLKIMLGLIPIFIVAGFLEGFVTRHTELPDSIRAVFIILCFAFVIWYYYIYPKRVSGRPGAEEFDRGRRAAEGQNGLRLSRLRGIGEILDTSIGVMRQVLGRILSRAALLATGFTFLSFVFFNGPGAGRYFFAAEFLTGDLHNFYALFTTFGYGRNFTYTLLVALFFYGVTRVAFQLVRQAGAAGARPFSWASEAKLFGSALLMAIVLSGPGWMTAIGALFVFPFLFVAAYLVYFGMAKLKSSLAYIGRDYFLTVGSYFLLLLICIPLLLVVDGIFGAMLFSFLDWLIYIEDYQLANVNNMLQCWTYAFCFGAAYIFIGISFSFNAHRLQEINAADHLLEDVRLVGSRRRLRGMELEA